MELIQLYNKSAIQQIYSNVLQLSIFNYQTLPEFIKEELKGKYENALLLKDQLTEPPFDNIQDITEFLTAVCEDIQRVRLQNQPVIDLYTSQVEQLLDNYIPNNLNCLEKLEFLFDFITNWISFSEDTFQYCCNIPPANGLFFNFYHGVPLSNSYAGLLVTRQGLSGDIANLYVYLARNLGINLETISYIQDGNLYTINKIALENGGVSYIDATAVIRGLKTKREAFLVSKDAFNQTDNYQLESIPSFALKKMDSPPYQMSSILSYLPTPRIVSIHSVNSFIKN